MKHQYLRSGIVLAAALAAVTPLVRAQTAPAAPVEKKDASDEVVTLSPFAVTSEDDHGYTATQTLAGTRLRTEMRDLGAAISVVTKDFLNDTGVTNNGTLLTYTTSTEVGGVHGNYSGFGNGKDVSENRLNPQSTTRIRGLDDADNTRDYFLTDIPWDSYNVDRVDTVRGPNSILYGLGSPAGVVNTSLNEAGFKQKTVLETRVARFGSYRASVDANIVLLPQELAVRVDSVYGANKFRQQEAFNNDFRQYMSVRYDPKALNNDRMTTSFKVNFEHGKIDSNNPTNSPPVDAISPWFDTKAGNKFTTDPFGTWTSNLTGPYWTPTAIRNDGDPASDVGFPTGGGQSVIPASLGGGPNMYFNPWLGTGGYQGGVTYVNGYGATAQTGRTFVQPKISIGSNVSVLGGGIEGIPYSQHNGVTTFPDFATRVRMPGYQTGLYKQRYITDTSIFNYYDHLIGGDNSRQWQNWNVFTVSGSQTYLGGRVGYEAVYHQEQYHNGQWSLYGGNSAINVETDLRSGDGLDNPNFGKPYIVSNGRYGNNSNDIRREDVRITGFGEVRGSDFFDANSWAAKFIGKQRFTGLYTTDDRYLEKREWMLYAADPAYTELTLTKGAPYDIANAGVNLVSFLGNSLYATPSLTGANLSAAGRITVPTDGSINQFVAKWIAPPSLDPNGVWTPAQGLPGSINSHNPANYQGYTVVPVHVLSAFNPAEKAGMYVGDGNQKSDVKVTSKAGIWQGYFLDGTIVPLFGWRKDTVRTAYKSPVRRTNNSYDLSDPSYVLGTANEESGTTKTYSLVLHLPQSIKAKLPLGMDLGVYYNKSSNFRPGAGRVDIYGNPLANPTGKTKDVGVIMSFLDEKITVKVNKYEMDLQNASSSINVGYIGSSLRRDWAFEERYRTGYGEDWQHVYTPWAGQTQEQADALKNGAIAALQTFIQDPDVKKLYEVWNVTKGDPANSFKTDQWDATVPNGVAAVQDSKSKGYEIEVSANLTRNWTLTANVTKTTATVENVGGTALVDFVKKYHDALQGPMGEIRYWWGGSDALARNEFNNNFYGQWSQATIGAGADVSELRPWHVNVISTYRFSEGRLKGLMAGAALRWQSAPIIGYPTTIDSKGEYHFDLAHPWYGSKEPGLDAWVGYDFKVRAKTRWHVQVNLRNLLANDSLIPVSRQYDGGPAAYRIPEPFGWEFSSRLEF